MMKQLPGLSAAVGIFVGAYGSWLNALLCDFLLDLAGECVLCVLPLFPSQAHFGLLFPWLFCTLIVSPCDCWLINTSLHNCIVKLLLLLFNLGRKAKKWKRE